jgi:histidinol-phosphatase (PHP family)
LLVDYHTHSKFCRHATGELDEYVQAAIELGLQEVGCSDHAPLPENYDLQHRMTLEEYYSSYAPAVSDLVQRYRGKIRIKRGIECDFLEWSDEWTRKFVAENDFDFVIGSVHFVGSRGSEKPLFGPTYDASELPELHESYYHSIKDSASSGLFDIIGHCDLVKKLGACAGKKIDEALWAALEEIRKSDLCIEINTSGWRRAGQEAYPAERILAFARDLGIPMTLGSDAHKPLDVAWDFDRAVALIERYGRGRISTFEKRQRSEAKVNRLGH